jgi:hypothetical protein
MIDDLAAPEDAAIRAAQRADELLDESDVDGPRPSAGFLEAIDELRRFQVLPGSSAPARRTCLINVRMNPLQIRSGLMLHRFCAHSADTYFYSIFRSREKAP